MTTIDDPHAVYTKVFEAALQRGGVFSSLCLVALPVSHRPMNRFRRFIHIAWALRDALIWCRRHQFMQKQFVVREFSTWALLVLFPLAFRCRSFVSFNVNHNLVGRGSRLVLAVLSRFLNFYYFSGRDEFEQAPRYIRTLNVSTAYGPARRAVGTRHAMVLWPKRADQFEPSGLEGLEQTMLSAGIGVTMVGRSTSAVRLSYEEYIAALLTCSDLVLAYHQGKDVVRHSGVIWDAILHGVPRIYVPDTLSFRNQVGDGLEGRVVFYSSGADLSTLIEGIQS